MKIGTAILATVLAVGVITLRASTRKSPACYAKGKTFMSQTLDNGGPPGSGMPDPNAVPCCAGLIERNSIAYCGSTMSGRAEMICTACGDKKCDSATENSCNCPEDCR